MGRRNKVIKYTILISRERNALHGVNDVLVESRKKSETVFTGKWIVMFAGILIRDKNTARFTTGQFLFHLEDLHFKSAFNEFVRSAHSCNAATEDDYFGHVGIFRE